MPECLVSVVMPFYNNERHLAEAIESIVAMSAHNMELILVNDGSIDGSDDIARSYLRRHNWIRLLEHKNNKGAARATKTGLLACKGKYIFLAAADDCSLPGRIEACVNKMEAEPDMGMVVTRAAIIDDKSVRTGESYGPPHHIHDRNICLNQLKRNYCLGACLALRNDRVILTRKHLLEWIDDYQLSLEYILAGYQIGVLQEEWVLYRIHSGNVSNNRNEQHLKVIKALQPYDTQKFMDQLSKRGFARGDLLVAAAVFELFRENREAGEALLKQAEGFAFHEQSSRFEQLFYLAVCDYDKGQYKRAYQKLLQALAQHPDEPTTLNNLAVCARHLDKPAQEMEQYLHRSLSIFPTYQDARHNLHIGYTGTPKFTRRLLDPSIINRIFYRTSD